MRLIRHGVGTLLGLALAACVSVPRPALIEPVRIEDAIFTTRGPRFAPGLYATVRVCIAAQGQVSSATVVLSSGDKRFDDFVLGFTLRVQARPQRINGRAVPACDIVRVEINHITAPGIGAGSNSAVG